MNHTVQQKQHRPLPEYVAAYVAVLKRHLELIEAGQNAQDRAAELLPVIQIMARRI